MRKIVVSSAAALALMLAACGQPQPYPVDDSGYYVDNGEDCDAEDYRNREAECGFTNGKWHKKKKKKGFISRSSRSYKTTTSRSTPSRSSGFRSSPSRSSGRRR